MSSGPSSEAIPGWFGKIPNLGDFAARRLPDSFIRPWDEWLQLGLSAARAGFRLVDEESMQSSACRFWISPGVLGRSTWTGVLAPSSDRVGRRFPLTIAQPRESGVAPAQALGAALAARDWFSSLDRVVVRTRDPACTVDELEEALEHLRSEVVSRCSDDLLACRLLRQADDAAAGRDRLPDLDGDAPQTEAAPCSIWWHDGASDAGDYRRYAGLPPPDAVPTLLASRNAMDFDS